MTINKSYFVDKVNDFFSRDEGADDLDDIIADIVYDASCFGDILLKESNIELAEDSYYVSLPTTDSGGKCKKVLAIYYDDYELMEKILWNRMKGKHSDTDRTGKPEEWSISPDNYIFFSPIADADYTFYCAYSYWHPLDADNIEFDDELRYAISYGVMWQYALSKGLKDAANDNYQLYVNTMRREAAQRKSKLIQSVKWKRGM